MTILLVEDDISMNHILKDILEDAQYKTLVAENYQSAIDQFLKEKIDLVILDIQLPDGDGIDLCKNLRQISNVPILFLTGSDDEETLVKGLNSGGDDYVTKPFRIKELLARINSLLRRSVLPNQMQIGDLMINLKRNEIYKKGKKIDLSMVDFEILKTLIINKDQVLTRQQLLSFLDKEGQYYVENNTLSVHMKRIREKIGLYQGLPYIETVRGIGYRMNLEVIYGNK